MAKKTDIKDFYGRVIGTVVEESNGDKAIKDFYGRPLGYYKKSRDVTTDFYGRVVASGDQLAMLLNAEK
jgi:hypothetical protein